jgi:protein disulfide-isomerase A6
MDSPADPSLDCKSLAPVWEQLAWDFSSEPSVVIAKLDADSPDSKKTAENQRISGYPTIKWFPAGSTEPVLYSGPRTEPALVEFVNANAGTFRAPGGGLTATAGTIAALDAVMQGIGDAGGNVIGKLEAVIAAAKSEQGKYAKYYIKVAEKMIKTPSYVEKELSRLNGIIKKGSVAPKILDDIISRSNILRGFKGIKADGKQDEKSEL